MAKLAQRYQLRVWPLGFTVVDTKKGGLNVTQQVGAVFQDDFPAGVVFIHIRSVADDMVAFANKEMDVDIRV